jgi:transcriptional regulator with XRE-family HTH domain
MRDTNRLGELLKTRREALGLTQRELAQRSTSKQATLPSLRADGASRHSNSSCGLLIRWVSTGRNFCSFPSRSESVARRASIRAIEEERRHGSGSSKTTRFWRVTT